MENAAKALGIAAGVLLAVILMSLIAYFFSNISKWPQQQDDMESAEQLAKFNKEYEVYEKSQMYGVDVISCLNKAKSNNEKYVDGNGFLNGTTYGKNYTIDICVRIDSPLDELLQVYYFSNSNVEEERTSDTYSNGKLSDLPKEITQKLEKSDYYTALKTNMDLTKQSVKLSDSSNYMVKGGGSVNYNGNQYYSLLNDGNTDNSPLGKLINFSTSNPKITVKNSESNLNIWSKVVWTTALYNFKTRRFTCDNINYNENGRINKIYFSEVK